VARRRRVLRLSRRRRDGPRPLRMVCADERGASRRRRHSATCTSVAGRRRLIRSASPRSQGGIRMRPGRAAGGDHVAFDARSGSRKFKALARRLGSPRPEVPRRLSVIDDDGIAGFELRAGPDPDQRPALRPCRRRSEDYHAGRVVAAALDSIGRWCSRLRRL